MIHRDRARAESFGADPERYDRARPRYPQQLVDDLLDGGTPNVLDVGCGTGIAAEAFAAAGCDVLGVEPDGRMAAVARAKGIPVENATFEDWPSNGRVFDLVISGQAWHWVDPEAGPVKAATVLVPGGRLAIFWNLGGQDLETQNALDEVYARHAPALLDRSGALGRIRAEGRGEGDAATIRESGRFGEPTVATYRRTETCTTAQWLEMLLTYSDHALLDADVRDALLAGVRVALDRRGGGLTLRYETLLVTAVRS